MHVREPFDEEYRRCLIEALKPARIRPAGPHPARVEVSLPAFHRAEVKLAEGDDNWLPIEAEPTRDGPVWTWVFPAREISGLRLRPAPAGEPRSEVICREIEAWPQ